MYSKQLRGELSPATVHLSDANFTSVVASVTPSANRCVVLLIDCVARSQALMWLYKGHDPVVVILWRYSMVDERTGRLGSRI